MNNQNYGYSFNTIKVIDNLVEKSAKNDYGKQKIRNEIGFYQYIASRNVRFPVPKTQFIDISNASYTMEYLNNHIVATRHISNRMDAELIRSILTHLNALHAYEKIVVSREEYANQLNLETRTKVIDRFNETTWDDCNICTHVNQLEVHDIHYYTDKINCYIERVLSGMKDYYFTLIHGDAHLGNIMVNAEGDIWFIDPRGYFGSNKLYGIKEYDNAKLLFGLSGYSHFDEMCFEEVEIVDGNIDIPFVTEYLQIYDSPIFSEYEKLLSLTIWLSNNSMYTSPHKKFHSLMVAYYICERYLMSRR